MALFITSNVPLWGGIKAICHDVQSKTISGNIIAIDYLNFSKTKMFEPHLFHTYWLAFHSFNDEYSASRPHAPGTSLFCHHTLSIFNRVMAQVWPAATWISLKLNSQVIQSSHYSLVLLLAIRRLPLSKQIEFPQVFFYIYCPWGEVLPRIIWKENINILYVFADWYLGRDRFVSFNPFFIQGETLQCYLKMTYL